MLIKKLSLSNFKQYKEETIEDFPIGLTGLVGKNGSGKSTLFEAIYYALFGKSLEGKVVYLRNDHSEGAPLSVTLEFEEKENRYRVVRKVKGKNNTVEARLEILKDEIDPPHFKEIAVDATPVSREIYKILRIDAESFKNSFFAKQKETAGIINGTQTQRLEAFRKMLGFDKYDDLIDKIDKMIETTKNAAVTLSGFLLGAEVVIEYKEQIETLGADLKAKAETVAALKLDLNGKQVIKTERASVVNSLDKKRILHTKLGTSITATETSIKNTEDLLVSYEKKINELETLAAEIAVESHVIDEYDQINKLIENLNTSKNLKTRYDAIVENRQRTIIARDEVNSKIVASIEEMEGLPDYEAKITVEENLLSEKRLHLETLNERASDLRTNLNTVNNELKKCQSRLINVQKLDSEGVCPECERPLGEHKPQLVSKYNDEIAISIEKQNALNESLTTLGSQITEKKSEISVVESRIAELKELVVERERKIDLISQLKERVATLEATIGQANSDITALGEITFDQQQLDTALSSQEDIKSRYDKYNTKLGRVASLEATKQEKLDQMSILKNFGTKLESLKKEQQDVGFSEEEFAKVKTALEDISTVIEKVTETIHSEEKDLSEQKSKIENYTRELEKDSTHREQYSRMERDVTLFKIYKDVVNDYKAKMTKRAIPQVATNADKLFTELTGGRYMGLEMTDDLAVTVSRDGQSAPLSTLSGGEKDLAAICLRVAISQEIVSNASGGKIGFLAFDEVFGAQDEDRRDLLVQALQRLPEHFKQVFVVSHNGDVEAELPNRIVIVKRGHFSVIDRIVRNN